MSLKSTKGKEVAFDIKDWRDERAWKFKTPDSERESWQHSSKRALKEANDHWKASKIRRTSLKRESHMTWTWRSQSENKSQTLIELDQSNPT